MAPDRGQLPEPGTTNQRPAHVHAFTTMPIAGFVDALSESESAVWIRNPTSDPRYRSRKLVTNPTNPFRLQPSSKPLTWPSPINHLYLPGFDNSCQRFLNPSFYTHSLHSESCMRRLCVHALLDISMRQVSVRGFQTSCKTASTIPHSHATGMRARLYHVPHYHSQSHAARVPRMPPYHIHPACHRHQTTPRSRRELSLHIAWRRTQLLQLQSMLPHCSFHTPYCSCIRVHHSAYVRNGSHTIWREKTVNHRFTCYEA
jgi:hypothetical protein